MNNRSTDQKTAAALARVDRAMMKTRAALAKAGAELTALEAQLAELRANPNLGRPKYEIPPGILPHMTSTEIMAAHGVTRPTALAWIKKLNSQNAASA